MARRARPPTAPTRRRHRAASRPARALAAVAASRLYVVRGGSMAPSFRDGDRILVDHGAYAGSGPRRGDVVVVRDPRDPAREELKRVVGLPGNEVRIQDGLLYVDGVLHEEPYLGGLPGNLGLGERAWALAPGEYLVLGDNRLRSTDSRDYGPVTAGLIAGRAWLRYWPPRRWGMVR